MVQENGSHFKFVYSNWLTTAYGRLPIANGIHPEGIKKYYEFYDENIEIRFTNQNNLEKKILEKYPVYENFFMLGHSLLITYLNEFFSKSCFIAEEEIKNDDCVYFYPIETNGGNYILYNNYSVNIHGIETQCSFTDSIPKKIISLLKTNKVRLLICGIQDPCLHIWQLEFLYSSLEKAGIPKDNPILIVGNKRLDFIHNMVTGILSLYEGAKLFHRYPRQTQLGYISDIVRETELTGTLRNKRFLCFNRHFGRSHRIYLAYLYLKHKLYENSYFSFLFIDDINHIDNNFHNIKNILDGFDKLNLQKYINDLKAMVPIQLDTQHLSYQELSGFGTVDNYNKDFYNNTYVHIVSETCMNNENFTPFFSEKTVRPLMNLQPFVYFGDYQALKKLKELGFKTFHPFIDESYDEEPDPLQRMKLAGKQVVKLNNMPVSQLHDWYYSIKDILVHNQKHLQMFTHFSVLNQALKDAEVIYKNGFKK